ncbi:valine--tRNA ligase [Oxyplasma meridianum]|uniref:Valine--tRNA ligase n=1 Tax=Oxyplasma meridianum TaxID=3073602 RepID=A0AAX4NJ03_9ARCH
MDLDIAKIEDKLKKYWEEEDIYQFKINPLGRDKNFSIDTPPPTVSGKMHMGHAFSYPHQDFIARYKRMRGYSVFYPWGFDDNGLPTERYTEKLMGIRADKIGLEDFIKACQEASRQSENELLKNWKNMGISADFKNHYTTMSESSRKISQSMFLDLLKKGRAYREEAPTLRCPSCRTSISQIELKDGIVSTDFVYIKFDLVEGGHIVIATTRPEMIGACVAIFVNGSDERYKSFLNKKAIVPIYGTEVPLMADDSIQADKGTGAEMMCTFGDQNDLALWRKYQLPLKIVLDNAGRMNESAGEFKGLLIQDARKAVVSKLKDENRIEKTERIKHSVNLHERCDTPIEIGISTQWFVRYLDLKEKLKARANQVIWLPDHMKIRLDNWIDGLKWDWCISRQRFYGVPFPVWYCKSCKNLVLADESDLPVDPRTEIKGRKCNKCGSDHLEPERDVMDTWATSSLSPRLAITSQENFEKLYPMDIRFQGHDIITVWAFVTIVRSEIHDNRTPWDRIFISGNVYDPLGQKMSKSKGNVMEPASFIDQYGSDALRFWASGSVPGEDIKIKEQDFVRGRRTVIKLFNAFKLLELIRSGNPLKKLGKPPSNMENAWILAKISSVVKNVTELMDQYLFSRARTQLDNFFWNTFCDNYLEIIKGYGNAGTDPAILEETVSVAYHVFLDILKMYAPIMPFITDEIYLSYPEHGKSIHLDSWPSICDQFNFRETEEKMDYIIEVIGKIRNLKTGNKMSMNAPLERVFISGNSRIIEEGGDIIRRMMKIGSIISNDSQEILVSMNDKEENK